MSCSRSLIWLYAACTCTCASDASCHDGGPPLEAEAASPRWLPCGIIIGQFAMHVAWQPGHRTYSQSCMYCACMYCACVAGSTIHYDSVTLPHAIRYGVQYKSPTLFIGRTGRPLLRFGLLTQSSMISMLQICNHAIVILLVVHCRVDQARTPTHHVALIAWYSLVYNSPLYMVQVVTSGKAICPPLQLSIKVLLR